MRIRVLLLAVLILLAAPVLVEAGWTFLQYNIPFGDLPNPCKPGKPYWISDGLNGTDCSTGGGSTYVICQCDSGGTSYTAFTGSAGSGDITAVGSMLSGDTFADATADDDWLGLGASAGRILFDNQSTDEILLMDARVGVDTETPVGRFQVQVGTGSGITWTTSSDVIYDSSADLVVVQASADNQNNYLSFVTPSDTTGASILWDYDASPGVFALESGLNGVLQLRRYDSTPIIVIGTSLPSVELPIVLQNTDTPGTCSGTQEGAIYYDISTSNVCVCNGTNWVTVADGTTTC